MILERGAGGVGACPHGTGRRRPRGAAEGLSITEEADGERGEKVDPQGEKTLMNWEDVDGVPLRLRYPEGVRPGVPWSRAAFSEAGTLVSSGLRAGGAWSSHGSLVPLQE